MFVTNEYSVLRNIGKGKDVTLIPNKPFKAFKGNFIVSAYARILDLEGKEVVRLQAGDNIKGIKHKEVKDGNGL